MRNYLQSVGCMNKVTSLVCCFVCRLAWFFAQKTEEWWINHIVQLMFYEDTLSKDSTKQNVTNVRGYECFWSY